MSVKLLMPREAYALKVGTIGLDTLSKSIEIKSTYMYHNEIKKKEYGMFIKNIESGRKT